LVKKEIDIGSENPLVTIAIPTYNRANGYLTDAIRSALNQTYQNIEVLVSDNWSTDDTQRIVTGIRDERIKYHRQEKNIGFINNWNYCLHSARGEYFLLLCDDDLIDPTFIEKCIEMVREEGDAGLIVSGTRVIDSDGNVIAEKENPARGMTVDDFFLLWYRHQVHLFLCGCLFNRDALISIGGFDRKYNHYIDVAAEVLVAGRYGRRDVEEVVASFRKHEGSLTSATQIRSWCVDSELLLNTICDLAPDRRSEIYSVGLRSTAYRCYQMAAEIDSRLKRVYSYFVVYRYFKLFPSERYLVLLVPLAGYYYSLIKRLRELLLKKNEKRDKTSTVHRS
jgi:glycosyltransferase involved in cell wall biosynthesis